MRRDGPCWTHFPSTYIHLSWTVLSSSQVKGWSLQDTLPINLHSSELNCIVIFTSEGMAPAGHTSHQPTLIRAGLYCHLHKRRDGPCWTHFPSTYTHQSWTLRKGKVPVGQDLTYHSVHTSVHSMDFALMFEWLIGRIRKIHGGPLVVS